jgi:hypothetical protein
MIHTLSRIADIARFQWHNHQFINDWKNYNQLTNRVIRTNPKEQAILYAGDMAMALSGDSF